MGTLTVRRIEERLKARLRVRAARNGRSMEEEVRDILRLTLMDEAPVPDLGAAIHRRFARLGGIDLDAPTRDAIRETDLEK
ncbi:MAG: FitA-like ribbon-helix-helix domain-containing protein [Myxococcaceae bacterium]